MFLVKKEKSQSNVNLEHIVFIWGEKRERASCLGHFISPLLTSVAGTRGVGGAPGGFTHEPSGGDLDDRWSHCYSTLHLGVFVNLPLHCTLTTPSVAHRGGFSSHVPLMKEPKLRESKQHPGGPSQSSARSLGPLGPDPGIIPLN